MVEESDILACGGYLPAKYIGGEGERSAVVDGTVELSGPETGDSGREQAAPCETDVNAGGVGPVMDEERGEVACSERPEGVDGGAGGGLTLDVGGHVRAVADCANAPNEPNSRDGAFIAQRQDIIEVPTNSGGDSGLDGCQAKPILQTEPIPAGGVDASASGGSIQPVGRPLTDSEKRDAWKEIRRREWIRRRAEQERERLARLKAGVASTGTTSSTSGEAVPPQDVRGP